MQRKLAAAFAALAMSAALATTADGATTTLRLHTQADTTRFMSDSASGIVTMAKNDTADAKRRSGTHVPDVTARERPHAMRRRGSNDTPRRAPRTPPPMRVTPRRGRASGAGSRSRRRRPAAPR